MKRSLAVLLPLLLLTAASLCHAEEEARVVSSASAVATTEDQLLSFTVRDQFHVSFSCDRKQLDTVTFTVRGEPTS